jgi:hypothetical protein
MVINDLHVVCIRPAPSETDPPLVVDPDAMLAASAAFQCFEPISGWNEQVHELPGCMQIQQLSPSHALNGAEAQDQPVVEKQRGIGVPEGSDHTS